MEWTHRIYAREKGKNQRFGALDVGAGNIVGNLIYATVFDQKEAERVCAVLTEQNPHCEFQVRKI